MAKELGWNAVYHRDEEGMHILRSVFPTAAADEMNFVLFSTSGVHGTYGTIEDIEVDKSTGATQCRLTFLIVRPRIVALQYGNCIVESSDDLEFLRRLRESSHKVVAQIGMP